MRERLSYICALVKIVISAHREHMEVKAVAPLDEERRNLMRRLRDKYVDQFGYAKKVIIDDVLSQFNLAHESLPGALDLKNLDVIMKKRVIGKDVSYQVPKPLTESKLRMVKSQVNVSLPKQEKISTQTKGKTPSIIGKGKSEQPVELKAPEVTDKITNLPAPKPKIIRQKQPEQPKSSKEGSQSEKGPKPEINPLTGLPMETQSVNHLTKGMNRWGLLAMHKSQEFLAQKDADKVKKKQQFDDYKKILDQQMYEQDKLKALSHVTAETDKVKCLENNSSVVVGSRRKDAPDEKVLKSQYDSLQQEIEKNHILHPRGTQ